MSSLDTATVQTPLQVQEPSLKTIVLHNADDVSFQQVWKVLGNAFGFPIQISRQIAAQAHREGTADLYTASAEIVQARQAACVRACEATGCPQLPFSIRDV